MLSDGSQLRHSQYLAERKVRCDQPKGHVLVIGIHDHRTTRVHARHVDEAHLSYLHFRSNEHGGTQKAQRGRVGSGVAVPVDGYEAGGFFDAGCVENAVEWKLFGVGLLKAQNADAWFPDLVDERVDRSVGIHKPVIAPGAVNIPADAAKP